MAIAASSLSIMPFALASDIRPNSGVSTKVAFLQQFPHKQRSSLLGNAITTNLVSYQESCRSPQTIAQITPLCVSLGVLTGDNPDGSTDVSDLTYESPVSVRVLNPDEATSAPKPVPIGLVEPEQNDKVLLFPRP